jgi:aspartate aminotransferase/aromatic-amino-acid transaminase
MLFDHISPAPADAILGLTEAFKSDSNPAKINLGVGVYMDDQGKTPILSCVKQAEAILLEQEASKTYLSISGSADYASGVQDLLLGADHPLVTSGRIQTAHTPGGTGGLRLGGDFLRKFRPEATVWMSNPTWANHKGIFGAAGFPIQDYPYYDAEAKGLDFDGMMKALEQVPAGDCVLLHVCCHNPTGVDPSPEQWVRIADLAEKAGWFPFFDFAYQGFGESVEADREPLRLFAERNLEFVVAASFSKNFGLYSERTGSFSLVADSPEAAAAAFSHVKTTARVNYSNPPRHGGSIVEVILADPELRREWLGELEGMRNRIQDLRTQLVEGLRERGVNRDFSFISGQKGMFSFSGLTTDQVQTLRDQYSIYIVGSGRINVAGIRSDNLGPLCDAIAAVLS